MTELEDAVQQALRARASEIQLPVPPIDLRQRRTSRAAGRLLIGPWHSGQLRWLGPAAAVITVLALTAAAVLWRGADHGPGHRPAAKTETSVPAYYVALMSDKPLNSANAATLQTVATVRMTATGSEVARVAPPAPYTTFERVSGATGDRTFVLVAAGPADRSGLRPERFYLLHIDPQAASAADRTQLTALPAAFIPAGKQVADMSLSPNGANLAAILDGGSVDPLYVYNLLTQSTRTWTRTVCDATHCFPSYMGTNGFMGPASSVRTNDPPGLSWTLDSQSLAFIPGGGGAGQSRLRLLHIDEPGSNVEAESTAIRARRILPPARWDWAVLTPDGKTGFIGYTQLRGTSVWYGLARFSSVTGKLTRIYDVPIFHHGYGTPVTHHPEGEGVNEVMWTSRDGSQAVVLDVGAGDAAGIYAGSRYTPLKWPGNVVDAAW